MKDSTCPICSNPAPHFIEKSKVNYYQCWSCKTLFCGELDQENKIGGKFEVERNQKQNHERIDRIAKVTEGIPKGQVSILDWGCGTGYLINDLKDAGYQKVDGFDPYTEQFKRIPEKETYHVITAIEVIEHTSYPYTEINAMWRSLVPGGAVIIETGFTDIPATEGIELQDYFYIAPNDGHSTIFSHHGLDLLMAMRGFVPKRHFNNHVRLYQKIGKL